MKLFSGIKLVIWLKTLIKLVPFFYDIRYHNKTVEIVDYIKISKDQRDSNKKDPRHDHWSLPKDGYIKINVDASRRHNS